MAGLVVAWDLPVLRGRENYGPKGMIRTNTYSRFGGPKLENPLAHRKSWSLPKLTCERRRHGAVNMLTRERHNLFLIIYLDFLNL